MESTNPAMDNDMLTLLTGAQHSLTDIDMESFNKFISLKLRILEGDSTADNAFNTTFKEILSTFGPSKSYENGTNLTDVVYTTGQNVLVKGGKNKSFFGYLKLVSTEDGRAANYIWGTYTIENNQLNYATGTFNELGLNELFDEGGQFKIYYYQDLGEDAFRPPSLR